MHIIYILFPGFYSNCTVIFQCTNGFMFSYAPLGGEIVKPSVDILGYCVEVLLVQRVAQAEYTEAQIYKSIAASQ
jgi:hypothetical protein